MKEKVIQLTTNRNSIITSLKNDPKFFLKLNKLLTEELYM